MINKSTTTSSHDLKRLRNSIDETDRHLHDLIIQRGSIIEKLITVKGTAQSGSAFRPGREAEVMAFRLSQHKGTLPFEMIENIWRIMIATFTYQQAPYQVHITETSDDKRYALHDTARFHFGFTVPLVTHATPKELLAAIETSKSDLALLPIHDNFSAQPWWKMIPDSSSLRVIGHLPFVHYSAHPAGTPCLIIACAQDDASSEQDFFYGFKGSYPLSPQWEQILPSKSINILNISHPDSKNSVFGYAVSEKHLDDDTLRNLYQTGIELHLLGKTPKILVGEPL